MKNINIHNVRMGFATNSSSTHSIILLPGGAQDYDIDGDFGWNYFTAGSVESKNRYLALTLFNGLRQFTTGEIAAIVVREWCGMPEFGNSLSKWESVDDEGTIDHQSMLGLPSNWDGTAPHSGFFKDFRNFFLQDDVVVLGGNDNDSAEHPLEASGKRMFGGLPLEVGREVESLVARWDETYKFWTVFNRNTGMKIRMSFDKADDALEVERTSAPELVDLKITDYCPFGCEFCYQDSTTEGAHASTSHIRNAINALSLLNVFEVALGGGETTLHPDFLEILEFAHECHVVPNFTTKRYDWLRKPDFCSKVLEYCGAFAYSATNLKETQEFIQAVKDAGADETQWNHQEKATVQVVMGVVPEEELGEIMLACGEAKIPLTLLGYKVVGRGGSYKPLQYRNWLELAEKARERCRWGFKLGVDTVLAEQFDKQLKERGVDQRFYTVKEGRFSAYIDAVEAKMGPSSFCEPDKMSPLEIQKYNVIDQISEIYQGFA